MFMKNIQINIDSIKIINDAPFELVHFIVKDEQLWFVGKDVCEFLGNEDYVNALSELDDFETEVILIDTKLGKQMTLMVSEIGVYSLLHNMQKKLSDSIPHEKSIFEKTGNTMYEFVKWFNTQVVPTLLENGHYLTPKRYNNLLLNPDCFIDFLEKYKKKLISNQ